MKYLVKKIFGKIYDIGRSFSEHTRLLQMKKLAIVSHTAIIGDKAVIYNTRSREFIKIGNRTTLQGNLLLFKHGGEIEVGDFCFIGEGTRIWSAKKIKIGHRVLIAHNVNIHDNISHPLDSKARHLDQLHIMDKGFQENHFLNEKEIVIEDDAWIGFNATILKGVKIGRGAIIGACTVVTQDVPDFAVVIGNPARIIKYTT